MNGQYLIQMSPEQIYPHLAPFLRSTPPAYEVLALIELHQKRARTLREMAEQMSYYFVDDGAVNLGLHLGEAAEIVVHPDLDEIGMVGGELADFGPSLGGSLRPITVSGVREGRRITAFDAESAACGVEARPGECARALRLPELVNQVLV